MSGNRDKPSDGGAAPKKPGDNGGQRRDGLGDALKTVYGDTLREDIPAEMLALLGKLD